MKRNSVTSTLIQIHLKTEFLFKKNLSSSTLAQVFFKGEVKQCFMHSDDFTMLNIRDGHEYSIND